MKYKEIHFAELLISLEEDYQWEWKISAKRDCEKHKFIEYIYSLPSLTRDLV